MSCSSTVCWSAVATGAILLGPEVNSFDAELAGAQGLVQSLLHCLSIPGECGQARDWIHHFRTISY